MPWLDLPLERLREYRTKDIEPPELDQWWQLRLDEARKQARPPELTRYEADIYGSVEVYDAEFSARAATASRRGTCCPPVTLAPDPPYTEVPEFLAHNVDLIPAALDTLRYVDCALLARRVTARCLKRETPVRAGNGKRGSGTKDRSG